MLEFVNDISVAQAKAIAERREFCALCDSAGTPTVFAMAQGRAFCFLAERPHLSGNVNAFDYDDSTPGSMDTAIDMERSVEDDIEEYTDPSAGQANATGYDILQQPSSPIPGAWN